MNIMVKPNSFSEDQKKTEIIQYLITVIDDVIEIIKNISINAKKNL